MSRKSVSATVQANVLVKSRRRCCICFGLNRDISIKQGQIAHLDRDSANNVEENLAFLCFDHHNQYDSTTRQSKNLTRQEVIHYKQELISSNEVAFAHKVTSSKAGNVDVEDLSGHYIRDGEFDSAEVTVRRLPDGRYYVEGYALWGETRQIGPNLGDLSFVGDLVNDSVKYESKNLAQEPYRAYFKFGNGVLLVSEENWIGEFGMNVTFQGSYHKVSTCIAPLTETRSTE